MNKKQGTLLGIALILLFTCTALATSTTVSATSDVIIYAFDQNPAGSDEGNEWVTFHNPTNKSVDIGNWTFESTHGTSAIDWIAEGTILYPGAYCTYTPHYRWLDNSEEAIILRNAKGEVVDRTPVLSDNENDNRYWMRNNSDWSFGVTELEKGKLWSGYVKNVVDGDTVDVSFNIYGIRRVRLVGINTPEIGEVGYEEVKEFVNKTCWGEAIKLDVDDKRQYDPHYRILAVIYVNGTNQNEKLVKEGYAEVMYFPPSEFDPDTLNTIIEVAAIFFALLGGFVMHYLLSRNETIIEHLGLDYHCLRSTLHLFNYKPLYENPDLSKKILAPILDYLAYICQLWNISAVQGSNLRKNVLEASQFEGKLKEHFLDTAKKLDECQGKVRALPSGLFKFVLLILIVLAGTTLAGLWIKLIYLTSFNLLFFAFYAVLTIFFVLFFACIYDLKRIDAFFVILRPYDFLKWQFIRCLIFANNNEVDGPVKQYLTEAKRAYVDYTNLKYVKEETRKDLLKKAEGVAKQFLEKRKKRHEDREKEVDPKERREMKEDWEDEVEGTVPWAAIEALRGRFFKWYVAFIVAFSAILICPSFIFSYYQLQNQQLFLPWIVIPWIVIPWIYIVVGIIIVGLVVSLFLFSYWLGEKKPLPICWTRGVKIVSFLEDLPGCWDEIIKQHNKRKKMPKKDKEEEIYMKVEEEIKKFIKSYRKEKRKRKHV